MDMKKLKKKLTKPVEDEVHNPEDFLSSGCTILNLCCSDTPDGCYRKGVFHTFVGDSDTGKSWLAWAMLTEAAINDEFKDYRLVFDNAEGGQVPDLKRYFPPLVDRVEIVQSRTVEQMYYRLGDYLEKGPIVAAVDSMDALIAEADDKKFKKSKSAHNRGKEDKINIGLAKAKANSQILNRIVSDVVKTQSILMMISQAKVRIKMSPWDFGPDKARSGGGALKFYNRWEVWLRSPRTIKKKVKERNIQIGMVTQASVEKNHITGKKRKVEINIYEQFGIDDIGTSIDYLIAWDHWKGTQATVSAPEFDFKGKKEDLARKIENKPMRRRKLKRIVTRVWKEIEERVSLNRRPPYEGY